jgi:hypothetical protein
MSRFLLSPGRANSCRGQDKDCADAVHSNIEPPPPSLPLLLLLCIAWCPSWAHVGCCCCCWTHALLAAALRGTSRLMLSPRRAYSLVRRSDMTALFSASSCSSRLWDKDIAITIAARYRQPWQQAAARRLWSCGPSISCYTSLGSASAGGVWLC